MTYRGVLGLGVSRGPVSRVCRVVVVGMLVTAGWISHRWSGLVSSGLGRCGGSGGGCGCGSSSSVGRWASILVGPLIGLRGWVGWGWRSGLFGATEREKACGLS